MQKMGGQEGYSKPSIRRFGHQILKKSADECLKDVIGAMPGIADPRADLAALSKIREKQHEHETLHFGELAAVILHGGLPGQAG